MGGRFKGRSGRARRPADLVTVYRHDSPQSPFRERSAKPVSALPDVFTGAGRAQPCRGSLVSRRNVETARGTSPDSMASGECHPSRVAAPGQVFSPCVYLPAGGLHQPTRVSSTTRLSPGKAPSISRGDTHRLKRIYPERPKPVPGTARIRSFTSLRTKARSSRVGAAGKM